MDTDRETTPDPDLVTPATNPTPDADEKVEGEDALDAVEDLLPEHRPADGAAPLP